MMNFLKSSTRSMTSSFGAVSKTWIRCVSTDPEFVRPPGPMKSWTQDERNAWQRWRYANDSSAREKMKESARKYKRDPAIKQKLNQQAKERYANDDAFRLRMLQTAAARRARPEYRKAILQHKKERYANDPEYRRAAIEYERNRYANDADFRKAKQELKKKWLAIPKNRKALVQRHKERYTNDPEYRERMKRNARERYWKLKFGLATARAGRDEGQDNPQTPDKSDGSDAKP